MTASTRRDLFLIFLLGLAVNTLAARFIAGPRYVDAYYYFDGGLQLARGKGFTEPYLWNYLGQLASPAAGGQPRAPAEGEMAGEAGAAWPSHLYWMPLASIGAAP